MSSYSTIYNDMFDDPAALAREEEMLNTMIDMDIINDMARRSAAEEQENQNVFTAVTQSSQDSNTPETTIGVNRSITQSEYSALAREAREEEILRNIINDMAVRPSAEQENQDAFTSVTQSSQDSATIETPIGVKDMDFINDMAGRAKQEKQDHAFRAFRIFRTVTRSSQQSATPATTIGVNLSIAQSEDSEEELQYDTEESDEDEEAIERTLKTEWVDYWKDQSKYVKPTGAYVYILTLKEWDHGFGHGPREEIIGVFNSKDAAVAKAMNVDTYMGCSYDDAIEDIYNDNHIDNRGNPPDNGVLIQVGGGIGGGDYSRLSIKRHSLEFLKISEKPTSLGAKKRPLKNTCDHSKKAKVDGYYCW